MSNPFQRQETQDELLQKLLERGDTSERDPREALARFGSILTTGKAPASNSNSLASKIAYLNYKNQLEPKAAEVQEGFSNEADVPKTLGGLPLKTVKVGKGGRVIPEYAVEKEDKSQAGGLSPMQQMRKDKRMEDLITSKEINAVKLRNIQKAREVLPKVPKGLFGGLQVGWMKAVDPDNPILTDWQRIKMIGTDAQLLNTALTKGAISDREMDLFAKAAANDDMVSMARLTPVLEKLENFIAAEESAKRKSYQSIYNEDPAIFLGGEDAFTAAKSAPPLVSGVSNQPKQLDANTAKEILRQAGGDKNKARQIAQSQGYTF